MGRPQRALLDAHLRRLRPHCGLRASSGHCLPLLVSAVPVLAFAGSPLVAIAGALLWGAAGGVLDSTIKALVADLVPASRLATAYGLFAAVQGAAAVAGESWP